MRRTDTARLRAAELALAEDGGDGAAVGAHAAELRENPELEAELSAFRALTQLLDEVPGEAWQAVPSAPARRSPVPWLGSLKVPRLVPRLAAGAAMAACLAVGLGVGLGVSGSARSSGSPAGAGSVAAVGFEPRDAAVIPGDRFPNAPHVAFAALPGAPAGARADAYMSPATGHMLLHVKLAPSPPGTYYELWLMSSATDLVPVASFQVGSRGEDDINVVLPGDPSRYRYLDISRQTVGGGTGHSGSSIVRAKLA